MASAKVAGTEWHSAKQGLVGVNGDNCLYGLTCRHVTVASDGTLFMKNNLGQGIKIAVLKTTSERICKDTDIDCFRVTDDFVEYFNKHPRKFQECCVFEGQLHDLYDQQVFRCEDLEKRPQKRVYGRVASREEHDLCKEEFGSMNRNFLVTAARVDNPALNAIEPGMLQVAKEGNSGDFIAMERNGRFVVVGIITSGDYIPNHRKGKPPYTICLFFRSALGTLKEKFRKLFASCVTLLFKTPEKINRYAFDLADALITLTDFSIDDFNIAEVDEQLRHEKNLSKMIDSRSEINKAIFQEDDPVQACVINSVMACNHIWGDRLKKAELCLKDAIKAMPKIDKFFLHMLCKVITYVAWFLRLKQHKDDSKNVLDEGWEFMKEFKDYKLFPHSSEFYMYFEYTMFYRDALDLDNAANYSLKAIDHSWAAYRDNTSSESSRNRHMLAVCQYADIKLKCGDNFDTRDELVSEVDIADVYHRLNELERIREMADPTAQSYFLLKKCDLYYKRNCIDDALKMAEHCRVLARKAGLKKDVEEAIKRIKVLQECY